MRRLLLSALIAALLQPAAAAETRLAAVGEETAATLTIKSTTDLSVFKPIVEAFQARWRNVAISYDELTTNELNAQVAEACAEGQFAGDLVISSSIDQQLKLVNDGCSRSPGPELGAVLPDWAKWRDELFGLTFEPAVTVYNRAYFEGRRVPQNRFELIDLLRESQDFSARVGTYDIETSGVGYLFAFEDALQASTWGRLVESLGRNQAQLFCCTADILDRVADGRLLVGYNVLGSYALQRIATDPRIGIILPSDYTLIMARAGFIARDARQPELARLFLSFMLSEAGREILSGEARMLSPVEGAERLARLAGLESASLQALRPITLSPALLVGLDAAKRQLFLQEWRAALPKDGNAVAGGPPIGQAGRAPSR